MVKKEIKIIDKIGLHARPASEVCSFTRKLDSEVKMIFNGKEANLKSVINVLALGVVSGSVVTIEVSGKNEVADAKRLIELFKKTKLA